MGPQKSKPLAVVLTTGTDADLGNLKTYLFVFYIFTFIKLYYVALVTPL